MKLWKKVTATLLLGAMLAGCSSGGNTAAPAASSAAETASTEAAAATSESTTAAETEETISIPKLTIVYVKSRPDDDIVTQTSGMKDILINGLAEYGYEVGEVEITISESYNAAGEALSAGSADIGYIPGGTYALYGEELQLLLTATRDELTNDSEDPADWNGDENATDRNPGVPVTYYKGLIYAGPSAKGQELAAKVNAGEELTWEDVSTANWALGSLTSNASYIYPNLWLNDKFGKKIDDLPNKTTEVSQPNMMTQAAAEQVDIICAYADARMDNVDKWTTEYNREDTIWNELQVIGVTPNIFNDSVCLSKTGDNAEVLTSERFQQAMTEIYMALPETPEGLEVIGIYSHSGYQPGNDSDYDAARNALKAME